MATSEQSLSEDLLTKNEDIVPQRVWLSLTGRCNHACTWCYRSGSERTAQLSTDLARHDIDVLRSCGVKRFTLIGGEPTLHQGCSDILEHLLAAGDTSCMLVTNGRQPFELPYRSLTLDNFHLVISLHGSSAEQYRLLTRNQAGFRDALDSIEKANQSGIRYTVNIVLSKDSFPFMNAFLQIAREMNIAMLCFTLAINSIDRPDECQTDPFELARMIQDVHALCEETGIPHMFICSIPWCLLENGLAETLFVQQRLMFNCPIDQGKGLVINEDHTLSVCTHLSSFTVANAEETNVALASREAFIRFWNSSSMGEFRASANVYRHEACVRCKFRTLCKGGCPLWWRNHDFNGALTSFE